MKVQIKWVGVFALFCCFQMLNGDEARAWSHYAPGALGVKTSTCPPPGLWWVNYNAYYSTDEVKDGNGDTIPIPDFNLSVYANVTQIAYVTDKQILGGNYGVDLFIPFVYTDLKSSGIGENNFGLGDMFIDPLIVSWNRPRWDAFIAAGAYIPTGKHDEPTSPGKGYWTFMEEAGGTYYFDESRSWTVSARARFEQSTEDDDTGITPGDELIFEYGVGKDVAVNPGMIATVGLAGYSYWQLAEDSGPGASDTTFSGHAAGPELQLTLLKPYLSFQLRYEREYGVKEATQGSGLFFNIISSF